MDDLEDLIKLNKVLKAEVSRTTSLHHKSISLEDSSPNTSLSLKDNEIDGIAEHSTRGLQEDIHLQVDYSEEIERDAKEAEKTIILQKLDQLLHSGLEVPACVTESFISFDKDDCEVIEQCTSKELKQLMLLNRTKRKHLVDVLKQVLELLNATNKIVWQRQNEEMPRLKSKNLKNGCSSLGTPFFKLRNNKVSCWSNPDLERKRQNKELVLSKMIPPIKWTTKDKLLLKKFVAVFYSYTREKELNKKIKNLENMCKREKDADQIARYNLEIEELKKEVDNLQNSESDKYPELNSADSIDWYEISEQMNGRHSASECKTYWNMFLHPDRTEDKWSKSEDNKLIGIAKKYNYQNWEQITEELGVGRSPFAICSRYYSKLCTKKYRREKFQPEEDELLLDIIETCKIGNYIPWSKVSYYFNGRTKAQLYHRYTYYLSRKNTRKYEQFSFDEDALIMALVERLGKNFSKVAEYVPYRSSMQIKNRYNCYLENPNVSYRPFALEEDRLILLHGAEHSSSNWGKLAKQINLPRSHLRHRYNTLSKWIANNPDKDLTQVPRRYICKAKELNAKFVQLKAITNALRHLDHIPTLKDVKNVMSKKKLNIAQPNSFVKNTIHQQIINYFKTSYKISRAYSFVTEVSTEKDATIINDILQLLGAELELPNPSEIENDSNLDKMDVFILNHIMLKRIKDDNVKRSFSSFSVPSDSIKWSLPPNLGTVVGLRNMIMTMSMTKSKSVVQNTINYGELIAQNLESLPVIKRERVVEERSKFQQRLYAVFRWPSLMSLINVGDIKSPCTEMNDTTTTNLAIAVNSKSRGRPKKDSIKINVKIKKMLEGKQKKKKERDAAAELLSANNYISVKEFARMDSFRHLEDDSDEAVMSDNINFGASTSRGCRPFTANIPSQAANDLTVKKTQHARTYKRKRTEVQNESTLLPKICIIEEDIKPVIKEEID